jgi:hypothetical protein
VTKYRDHRNQWIVELGPWHVSRGDADNWAESLQGLGYVIQIESSHGDNGSNDNDDLKDALSSMA